MKKLLIAVAALFSLIILILITAVAVPFFISANVYKAQITSLIEKETDRDFRIDGPITVTLLPQLALSAQDVSFANTPGGIAPQMAQLKSLEIRVRLGPLLSGKIEIDSFVLVEPEIALEIDRQGHPNWRFGEAAPVPASAVAEPTAAPATHKIGDLISLLDRFHVAGFEIRNGSASFFDARDGEQWRSTDINVKFAMAGLDSPLTADGNAVWGNETVYFDYAVARPGAFAGGDPSHIELHVSSRPVDFDFSGDGVGEPKLKLSGSIVLTIPSLRGFAKWTGIPIPPQGAGLGRFAIKGTLDIENDTYDFGHAEMSLDAIRGTGGVVYVNSGKRPNVRGSLLLDALDLNPYLVGATTAVSAPQADAAVAAQPNKDWSDAPIDLSLLRLADIYFELGTGSIRYRKITIGESALNLQLKNGRLDASLTELTLYGGKGAGEVIIDLSLIHI